MRLMLWFVVKPRTQSDNTFKSSVKWFYHYYNNNKNVVYNKISTYKLINSLLNWDKEVLIIGNEWKGYEGRLLKLFK